MSGGGSLANEGILVQGGGGQVVAQSGGGLRGDFVDGGLGLAVLVGASGQRWSSELGAAKKECKEFRGRLEAKGISVQGEDAVGPTIAGLAVFRNWRFVTQAAGSNDSFVMMQGSASLWPRRMGWRFLEHDVVASAELVSGGMSPEDILGANWLTWPAAIAGPRLLKGMQAKGSVVKVTSGEDAGQRMTVGEVRGRWVAKHGLAEYGCWCWKVARPLAVAMAKGVWAGDVSVVYRRKMGGEVAAAPALPGAAALRKFLAMVVADGYPAEPVVEQGQLGQGDGFEEEGLVESRKGRGPRAWRYTGQHIVACLKAGEHLKQPKMLQENLVKAMRWWYPRTWRQRAKSIVEGRRKVPAKATSYRNVVQLDIAAMLARRRWYGVNGPTYRYISFDASPQVGQELFATVERIVNRSKVGELANWTSRPTVQTRRLPVATLGHLRMGLAEKAQCYVHQTWLEYGPEVEQVRAANADVRVVLSDMGTELGIGDALDMVEECLRGKWSGPKRRRVHQQGQDVIVGQAGGGSEEAAGPVMLFPHAIVVPGPQHIIDGVAKDGVGQLAYWEEWLPAAKLVSQWLKEVNHRRWLKVKVEAAGMAGQQVDVASLDHGCDSFADWRWNTLEKVTRDLVRMETAFRVGIGAVVGPRDIGGRDFQGAVQLWGLAKDDEFWFRTHLLQELMKPLHELQGWVKGCDCHEEERRQGKVVDCDWQGCRAGGLAQRVEDTIGQMEGIRAELVEMGQLEESIAATRMLGGLREKFGFLHEEPYTLWRANSRQVVRDIISRRDSLVEQGQQPHRVTEYFVGQQEGSFRADMEAFANGGQQSERLWQELMSYQLGRIDDTWAEAAHRDITGVAKRGNAAKVPFLGAMVRRGQTLREVELMTEAELDFFHKAVENWRAIARTKAPRKGQLVDPRGGVAQSMAKCGGHGVSL